MINNHTKERWKSHWRRSLKASALVMGLGLTVALPASAQYVKTDGTQILDETGAPLYLSGINLGNWLLWEGYLMMGDFNYRTHTQFLNSLEDAFQSAEKARQFEHEWRLNYVEENAIADLKRLGFNTLRVPFHYNMFWHDGALSNHGFQYFDQLIDLCREQGMYILLDMHAAPGYQNPGDHADNVNSNASQPRDSVQFWDGNHIAVAAEVWRHIANYYKNEPVILGYDLINEPVPQPGRELELLGSLVQLRNAIRQVDQNHMIVAEGSWWGSDLTKIDWQDPQVQAASGINAKWDHNLVYQIHHYGHVSGTQGREQITNRLGIPLIIGEYGETDEGNLKAITDWAKQNLAGYFPWSFKKMSHDKTLWTIPTNSDYEAVKQFINQGGTPPAGAFDGMMNFARNNIVNGHASHLWHEGFYQAVKPGGLAPEPEPELPSCDDASASLLPARIEAENYCASFGVQQEQTGDVDGNQNIGWIDTGDWTEYKVQAGAAGNLNFALRAAVNDQPGRVGVYLDGVKQATLTLPVTGDWQVYQSTEASIAVAEGEQTLRLVYESAGINLNWLSLGLAISQPEPEPEPEPEFPCVGLLTNLPAKIEAESYCSMQGVQTEPSSEGGLNVGWTDAGDWLDFGDLAVTEASAFVVGLRVASNSGGGRAEVWLDNNFVGGVDVSSTGGWQNWQTLKFNTTLAAGSYSLRVRFSAGGVNLNWLEFSTETAQPVFDLAPGTYVIVNENSGKSLDVADLSNANGANVQQWDYSDGLNQQWLAQSQGGNQFELINVKSGLCLDADSGSNNVHQWQCFGNQNQRWQVETQADGSYIVRTGDGADVLQVNGGSGVNGANVITDSSQNASHQRWRFEAVNN
ncbi:carbohydrate-binding protein [Simiduia curdlanivorans]|uniref:Carbohydrate-binding protein n=1 Tax=Simiduia curdlanivorans TaxID=1492769 RepID=A0ABV8V1E0_9GAMM|nr:carbohydrate-binding protein [Simiduia curdlanivorans]MDN3637488.1 carbohydrate-binding protein [Simiduia curdlanivorans]